MNTGKGYEVREPKPKISIVQLPEKANNRGISMLEPEETPERRLR